jgi:hypothetical protein
VSTNYKAERIKSKTLAFDNWRALEKDRQLNIIDAEYNTRYWKLRKAVLEAVIRGRANIGSKESVTGTLVG